MPVAFAITRAEEEVARKVFTGETPTLDGSLFRFRAIDVKPALESLVTFATETGDADEANAALRLSGRLGTWFGRNVSEQSQSAVSVPVEVRDPSPAPRSRRKPKPVEQAIVEPEPDPVDDVPPEE